MTASTEDQARERAAAARQAVDGALRDLAASLTGGARRREEPRREQLEREVNAVLRYLHRAPVSLEGEGDPLDLLSDRYGVESRAVELPDGWWHDAVGPYLGELDDGQVVALLPRWGGYAFRDPATGAWVRVGKKTAGRIRPDAVCLYAPLPVRVLSARDLLAFVARSLSAGDVAAMVAATLGATLAGMLTPAVTRLAFAGVVPSGAFDLVGVLAVLLCGAAVATGVIGLIKGLVLAGVKVRAKSSLQAAVMVRVMAMPAGFFRAYPPGDIAARLKATDRFADSAVDAVFGMGLTGVFSLLYIAQIVSYAPALVLPALVVLAVQLGLSVAVVAMRAKRLDAQMRAESELDGYTLSVVNGVQKIRIAGAEPRIFASWARRYARIAELRYNLPGLLLWYSSINAFIAAIGTVVLYLVAAQAQVPYADFVAFSAAYGMVGAGVGSLLGIVNVVAQMKPVLSMLAPIMQASPENEGDKPAPGPLSGAISVDHVTFGYDAAGQGAGGSHVGSVRAGSGRAGGAGRGGEGGQAGRPARGPVIIDDLSLEIRPGEYVGICGSSGCGKSTLMRLLLGFEKPWSGQVRYDGRPLDEVNLRALRRQIGTVQQEARLMGASIFQNIAVCAPDLTEEEAWEAAEAACLADDIRAMPMQMHTVLGEGGSGLSGGQKQRLLIARALASKPRIVFMDEATSALDNVAQAQVASSLAALRCTRVVIAHRLSTIRACDRIVVLDRGRIVEDGTYDELVARGGRFAELVRKQRLDV